MIKENLLATYRMLEKGIGLIDVGNTPGDQYKRTLSHTFIEAAGSHPKVLVINFKRSNPDKQRKSGALDRMDHTNQV